MSPVKLMKIGVRCHYLAQCAQAARECARLIQDRFRVHLLVGKAQLDQFAHCRLGTQSAAPETLWCG